MYLIFYNFYFHTIAIISFHVKTVIPRNRDETKKAFIANTYLFALPGGYVLVIFGS